MTPYLTVNRKPTNAGFGELVVSILTMLLIINYLQLREISVPKTVPYQSILAFVILLKLVLLKHSKHKA